MASGSKKGHIRKRKNIFVYEDKIILIDKFFNKQSSKRLKTHRSNSI